MVAVPPDDQTPRDAAHAYAAIGWPVLPCHNAHDGQCSCRQPECSSIGKHPRIRGGLHAATIDPQQIEQWWQQWPDANIAIRAGTTSGIVVVDIDPRHDGDISFGRLLTEHAPLPATLTVATPSSGTHLYFAHPGHTIRNDNGRKLGAGIDIRGDGGYIIAPPSNHATGSTYRWQTIAPVATMPVWLHDRLQQPQRQSPRHEPDFNLDRVSHGRWAHAALTHETHTVAHAVEGTRNDTLNRAAYKLGQLHAIGLLDIDTIRTHLLAAARVAQLPDHEATATITSGLNAGGRNPRTVPEHTSYVDHGNR